MLNVIVKFMGNDCNSWNFRYRLVFIRLKRLQFKKNKFCRCLWIQFKEKCKKGKKREERDAKPLWRAKRKGDELGAGGMGETHVSLLEWRGRRNMQSSKQT